MLAWKWRKLSRCAPPAEVYSDGGIPIADMMARADPSRSARFVAGASPPNRFCSQSLRGAFTAPAPNPPAVVSIRLTPPFPVVRALLAWVTTLPGAPSGMGITYPTGASAS